MDINIHEVFTILHWIFDYYYEQWTYSFVQKFVGEKYLYLLNCNHKSHVEKWNEWNKNRNIIFVKK